jgi:type I site-specific restriction-modification system R (restriction) subunit
VIIVSKKRNRGQVVGFYKDHAGETRPITKSVQQLNRTKVIQRPRQFQGVSPQQVAAEREKRRKEQQRMTIERNINGLDKLLQKLNNHLEQRGHDVEEMKKQYDQAQQQQDLKKALQIQNQMNRALITVQLMAKKRDAVQNKLQQLKSM